MELLRPRGEKERERDETSRIIQNNILHAGEKNNGRKNNLNIIRKKKKK